ncbi:MAG: cytochrome c oxidase accessory protein CcoG [Alphaproteobacteria bacterium]|nr:MAG: cytochrome c oxidase accessory protein CcoG [Alphaproteobacteria bacterium]
MAYEPQNSDTPPKKSPEIIPHANVARAKVEAVNKAENRALYAAQKKIHPKRAKGTFRTIKWWVMVVTLGIYYFSPWIRWDRGPGIPDQAILMDITNSRFYFFFIEIWPQEVYYITGLMVLSGIALFLVTSTAGRIWCGYTCPQTVWVDLFLVVERFFEGDRNARLKLDKAKWTADKFAKRTAKHISWLIISVLTGGAWVFYFNDAPLLVHQLIAFDAPLTTYFWIMILTSTTYLLGGFSREQVCTYMCPWPRIQGVMMDEDTLSVMYRHDRGEPRAPHKKGETWDGRGDCIQCRQCVVVCPVGIDIRDGMQLECIQCSLCIDACDSVMEQIGRPKGLIAYDSLANFDRRAKGEPEKIQIVRPRTLLYTIFMIVVTGSIIWGLTHRANLEVNVLRDRNPLFVELSSGDIRNGYTVKILNKTHDIRKFSLAVSGLDGYDIRVEGVLDRTPEGLPVIEVNRDRVRSVKVYLSVPRAQLSADSKAISITARDLDGSSISNNATTFRGPK